MAFTVHKHILCQKCLSREPWL